jgi:hypothetical protein
MNLNEIKQSVIHGFLDRCVKVGGMTADMARNIRIFANPTEEIVDAGLHRKKIHMFARGGQMLSSGGGARARLEENYLFDTRRFPTFVAAEAFPLAAGIPAQEYLFFQNAVGQPAINNGFSPIITVMTELETNMDVAGQIAQGKNFVFNQLGVSFNADIGTVDAGILLEAGALRFEKQGGQYALKHGPIRMWPGGTGIAGYAATAVGGAPLTIASAHNGTADIRAPRKLAIPRVIREKESFAYKYLVPRAQRNTSSTAATFTAMTAPCIMTIWLWGGQQDAIPV